MQPGQQPRPCRADIRDQEGDRGHFPSSREARGVPLRPHPVPRNQVLAAGGQLGQRGHEHGDDLRGTLGNCSRRPGLGDFEQHSFQGLEEPIDQLHSAPPVPGHRQVLANGPGLGRDGASVPCGPPPWEPGARQGSLTTDTSMAPLLWMPLELPTNSSSSFASSTTSDGCSVHRARNCELSTLPEEGHRWAGASLAPDPGPSSRTRARGRKGKL